MDQKAQLAAKEAEQAAIVTKTRNDEAAYQQMANDAKSQAENAAAQQRGAELARARRPAATAAARQLALCRVRAPGP